MSDVDLELANKTASSNSLISGNENEKEQNEDAELNVTSTKKVVEDIQNEDKKLDEPALDAPPKTMSNTEGGRGQMIELDEKKPSSPTTISPTTNDNNEVERSNSVKRQKSERIANAANEYINNINKLSNSSTNSSISSMGQQKTPNKISSRLSSYLAAVSTTSSAPVTTPPPVENRPRKCSNSIKEKSKMLEMVLNKESKEENEPTSPIKSSPTSNSISSMTNKPSSPTKSTEGTRKTSVSSFVKKQQEAYAASLIKDKGEDPSTKPIPSSNPRISSNEATALSNKNRQSKMMFEQMAKNQSSAPMPSNSSSRINNLDRGSLSSKNKQAKELFEQMAKGGDRSGISASPSSSSFTSSSKRTVGSISRRMEEKKPEPAPSSTVKEEPIKRDFSQREFKKEEVKPVVKEEEKK